MTIENRILGKGFKLEQELENKRFIYSSNIQYHTKEGNYFLYYNPMHDWILIWVGNFATGAFALWDNDKVQISGSTIFAGKVETDKDLLTILKCIGYENR